MRRAPTTVRRALPATDPAMIVLVHDGVPASGRLLGRQAPWPPGRYSCLAGFVEPGESAEAAVHREVAEEVGIDGRATCGTSASQPWPFPASLMLGFTALADPAEPLHVDPVELEDAPLVHPRPAARPRARAVAAPAVRVSIARRSLTSWLGRATSRSLERDAVLAALPSVASTLTGSDQLGDYLA